jgi:hypothetical protein
VTIEVISNQLNQPLNDSYMEQIKSGRIFEMNGSFDTSFEDVLADQSCDTIEVTYNHLKQH